MRERSRSNGHERLGSSGVAVGIHGRAEPLASDAGDEPEETPGDEPEETPGDEPEETPGVPSDEEGECCDRIHVILEKVEVKDLTESADDEDEDEVLVTAATEGRINAGPKEWSWPDEGDEVSLLAPADADDDEHRAMPYRDIASVEPDKNCKVDFATLVKFYEADLGRLEKALAETGAALARQAPHLLGPASGGGFAVVDPLWDLAKALLDLFLDLTGMGDDYMGEIFVGLTDEIRSDRPIAAYEWRGFDEESEMTALSNDELRVTRTLRHHQGAWEVSLRLKRICLDG